MFKSSRQIVFKVTVSKARFVVYLAGSGGRVSSGKVGEVQLVPLGRSRITGHGGGGNGFHPAIVLTCARALALSVIPGNRRRSSIAADNSPSWLKMARIASASASVTRNIPKSMAPPGATGNRGPSRLDLICVKYKPLESGATSRRIDRLQA